MITSAGLVLAATFLVLGTIPVVFLAELGVAVALGVMLDTLIVRSVLVTALNLDLGGKIWWPSKLDTEDRTLTADEVAAADGDRALKRDRPGPDALPLRVPGQGGGFGRTRSPTGGGLQGRRLGRRAPPVATTPGTQAVGERVRSAGRPRPGGGPRSAPR